MYYFTSNYEGFKYFIEYQDDEIIKPLCIILPQMSGYIKYFEKGGKTCFSWLKMTKCWINTIKFEGNIKEKLNIKFHNIPVYDETYLKAKVRGIDGKIKTNFLGDKVPKENMHCICIVCITIDSVMKLDKKNYPQVYLEECKYRVKKIQMPRFINAELEPDSESDSEAESKSDTELMAKLESNSDSE